MNRETGGVDSIFPIKLMERLVARSRHYDIDLLKGIDAGRLPARLVPAKPELLALSALMALQASRLHARSEKGVAVPLDRQDRGLKSTWESE